MSAPIFCETARVEIPGAEATNINAAIRRLWQEAAEYETAAVQPEQAEDAILKPESESGTGGGAGAMLRSCILNLVVVVQDRERMGEIDEALARLSASNPSRAIIVIRDDQSAPGDLRTHVSLPCCIRQGARGFSCCEKIVLRVPANDLARIAPTIVPLFVNDIPRLVWWDSPNELDHPLFNDMGEAADHLIIDSQREGINVRSLLEAIRRLKTQDDAKLTDLNWGRLTPWREITAQIFDFPPNAALLDSIRRIEIETIGGRGEKPPMTGLLYAGWMAQQLGWQLADSADKEAAIHAKFERSAGKSAEMVIKWRENADARQQIISVRLTCGSESGTAFIIEKLPQTKAACITTRDPLHDESRRRAVLENRPLDKLLLDELNYPLRDLGYERSVEMAVALAGDRMS